MSELTVSECYIILGSPDRAFDQYSDEDLETLYFVVCERDPAGMSRENMIRMLKSRRARLLKRGVII